MTKKALKIYRECVSVLAKRGSGSASKRFTQIVSEKVASHDDVTEQDIWDFVMQQVPLGMSAGSWMDAYRVKSSLIKALRRSQ